MIGLSAVLANLNRIALEIEHEAVPEGLEAAGEAIRDAWRSNIEDEGLVLTGRYRDSVHVERDGDGVVVKSDVPYAPILEHGDSRQDAHPVAQRASDEHADEVAERVGHAITAVIR